MNRSIKLDHKGWRFGLGGCDLPSHNQCAPRPHLVAGAANYTRIRWASCDTQTAFDPIRRGRASHHPAAAPRSRPCAEVRRACPGLGHLLLGGVGVATPGDEQPPYPRRDGPVLCGRGASCNALASAAKERTGECSHGESAGGGKHSGPPEEWQKEQRRLQRDNANAK